MSPTLSPKDGDKGGARLYGIIAKGGRQPRGDKIKIKLNETGALKAFLQTPPEKKKPKKKAGK